MAMSASDKVARLRQRMGAAGRGMLAAAEVGDVPGVLDRMGRSGYDANANTAFLAAMTMADNLGDPNVAHLMQEVKDLADDEAVTAFMAEGHDDAAADRALAEQAKAEREALLKQYEAWEREQEEMRRQLARAQSEAERRKDDARSELERERATAEASDDTAGLVEEAKGSEAYALAEATVGTAEAALAAADGELAVFDGAHGASFAADFQRKRSEFDTVALAAASADGVTPEQQEALAAMRGSLRAELPTAAAARASVARQLDGREAEFIGAVKDTPALMADPAVSQLVAAYESGDATDASRSAALTDLAVHVATTPALAGEAGTGPARVRFGDRLADIAAIPGVDTVHMRHAGAVQAQAAAVGVAADHMAAYRGVVADRDDYDAHLRLEANVGAARANVAAARLGRERVISSHVAGESLGMAMADALAVTEADATLSGAFAPHVAALERFQERLAAARAEGPEAHHALVSSDEGKQYQQMATRLSSAAEELDKFRGETQNPGAVQRAKTYDATEGTVFTMKSRDAEGNPETWSVVSAPLLNLDAAMYGGTKSAAGFMLAEALKGFTMLGAMMGMYSPLNSFKASLDKVAAENGCQVVWASGERRGAFKFVDAETGKPVTTKRHKSMMRAASAATREKGPGNHLRLRWGRDVDVGAPGPEDGDRLGFVGEAGTARAKPERYVPATSMTRGDKDNLRERVADRRTVEHADMFGGPVDLSDMDVKVEGPYLRMKPTGGEYDYGLRLGKPLDAPLGDDCPEGARPIVGVDPDVGVCFVKEQDSGDVQFFSQEGKRLDPADAQAALQRVPTDDGIQVLRLDRGTDYSHPRPGDPTRDSAHVDDGATPGQGGPDPAATPEPVDSAAPEL